MIAANLGNPFDLGKINDKYNLWLVEDTCDALGGTYNGQKVEPLLISNYGFLAPYNNG